MSTKAFLKTILAILPLLFVAQGAWAEQPLLQEGKKSVFQRVVTHPGAKLYSTANGDNVLVDPLKTFTVMYIYERQGDRMRVGTSSTKADGWIDASMVTEWPQAITMVFTPRTGREPVLFFRDHDALEKTCLLDDLSGAISSYERALQSNPQNVPADFPVIASEPLDTAVSQNNFYLMPVLGIDDQFYEQQGPRLIEVASINPGISDGAGGANAGSSGGSKAGGAAGKGKEYSTGYVFVIDTTISMKPYIDQTLDLVRRIYDELEQNPYADNVGIAVVAFRNNTKLAPGIGYTARVISDFTTVKDRKQLENALAKVQEASVSTHDVNEDSMAGIKEAVDKLSWDKYNSRVMMMVTDAGPLAAGDPASATGFSPEHMADYLHANNIYLTALHIKNPIQKGAKGQKEKKNQDYAERAYMALSQQSNNEASYIPLDATKGPKAFDSAAKALADSYSEIATSTAEGKLMEKPKAPVKKDLTPEEKARRIADTTGYAMQLQFFGDAQGSTAPEVVKAWIADADLEKLAASPNNAPELAVEPAILLTRGQLSNLRKQLGMIKDAAEKAFLSGESDLFTQIASAAAQMSRDPGQFSMHPDRNLAENGLLDEVLEGLPYKSVIGTMSQKNWEDMSTGQRDDFLRRLKSLRQLYDSFDQDNSKWESFGATNPNDHVYRVPLKDLP